MSERPRRGDEREARLKRARDAYDKEKEYEAWWAANRLLDRHRECADYGLTLDAEDDNRGDP